MIETAIGSMEFDIGFKKQGKIIFCEDERTIIIKAKAYYEEDGITEEQEKAIKKYNDNKLEISKLIKKLVVKYDKDAKSRFVPKTLLFGRNGECALLCDDREEPDEGIAVCLFPNELVVSQDDYL